MSRPGDYETNAVLRAVGDRSIEHCEGDYWGPAPPDATGLVARCHRLRTVPIIELAPGGLNELIAQHIGVDVLIPIALGVLRVDPLVNGGHYPGDLLSTVLASPDAWFDRHPDIAIALDEIVAAIDLDATDEYGMGLVDHVAEAITTWRRRRS